MLYRFARMLVAGVWVVLSLFGLLLSNGWRAVGLAVGMLVVLALAGVFAGVHRARPVRSVVQPTLLVTIAAVMAVLLQRRTAARGVVYLLGLAGAATLLGSAVWIGFDLGLGAGPLSAALLAVFVTLALPLIEGCPATTGRHGCAARRVRWAAASALLVAAALTAGGLVANREGATDPRQEMVGYSVDTDTKEAHWASGAAPASDWQPIAVDSVAVPLDDAFPWSAGSARWHGPAPVADLSAPAVTVLRDVTRGEVES